MKKVLSLFLLGVLVAAGCTGTTLSPGDQASSTSEEKSCYIGEILTDEDFDFSIDPTVATAQLECENMTLHLQWVKTDENSYLTDQLFINGSQAEVADFLTFISIQPYEDILLVMLNYGSDVTGTRFYALDYTGKYLFELEYPEDNGMYLKSFPDGYYHYTIQDDVLTFQGSRRYHGAVILTVVNGVWSEYELRDDYGGEWTDAIPDDETIEAQYQIRYLGNGSFGELTKFKTTMNYAEYKEMMGS